MSLRFLFIHWTWHDGAFFMKKHEDFLRERGRPHTPKAKIPLLFGVLGPIQERGNQCDIRERKIFKNHKAYRRERVEIFRKKN